MPKAPERTYRDETARRRAERLRDRRRAADRVAAPMFFRNIAEAELATQRLIDLDAGEYLVDTEGDGIATVSSRTVRP